MQEITIMGKLLTDFKSAGDLECPACGEVATCGWGVRTRFNLVRPQVASKYEYRLIASEYHICLQCHAPFVLTVNVITNEPYRG